MVAVWMVTYNHEPYIRQAIESVLMQETSFDFKLLIGEDYSSDDTRKICLAYKEQYPDKIELFLNESNYGSQANGINMYRSCLDTQAKYIALLEGDDYWTDPKKLHAQVNIMESNNRINLCGHLVAVKYHRNSDRILHNVPLDKYCNTLLNQEDIVSLITGDDDSIHTSSVLFRSSECFDFKIMNTLKVGDYFLLIALTKSGYAIVLDWVMSVYRKTSEGISSHNSKSQETKSLNWIQFGGKLNDYTKRKYEKYFDGKIGRSYEDLVRHHIKTRKLLMTIKTLGRYAFFNFRMAFIFTLKVARKYLVQKTQKG